jgi:hypothetical protein
MESGLSSLISHSVLALDIGIVLKMKRLFNGPRIAVAPVCMGAVDVRRTGDELVECRLRESRKLRVGDPKYAMQ